MGEWGVQDTRSSRSACRLANGDPHASGPRGASREWEGKLPGNKIDPLPKVQLQRPHLPRRRASPGGNPWRAEQGPSCWQPRDMGRCWHQALAGMGRERGESGPQGGFRVSKQHIGVQEHGNLDPRIQGRNPTMVGCLGLSLSRFTQNLM